MKNDDLTNLMRQCHLYPLSQNELKKIVNQVRYKENGQFDVRTFIRIVHYYFDILKMVSQTVFT